MQSEFEVPWPRPWRRRGATAIATPGSTRSRKPQGRHAVATKRRDRLLDELLHRDSSHDGAVRGRDNARQDVPLNTNRGDFMSRTIQIDNLGHFMGDQQLASLFAAYGAVLSTRVSGRVGAGPSTSVGFVEMESDSAGESAIAALNGSSHGGRFVWVSWADPVTAPR
jgi:RNA recognition motif-containing protein